MSISLGKPADIREQLNSYLRHLQRRLRLRAALRGAAILTSAALATTVFLVLIINRFAFSTGSVISARTLLLLVLAAAVALGLVLPLRRLNFRRAARTAESAFPQFQQRLVTFAERDQWPREPFLELLAADTLEIARHAEPAGLVPDKKLLVSLGAGLASFGVLIWVILAGPGFLGYGASLLWVGSRPGVAPMYDIRVNPGDASVRRNSDELVTALPIGVQTDKVRLYARYQSASKWEEVTMQPQAGGSGFQFLFAGLPENVEYYVVAGAIHSRHFNLRVVDLPAVKQIRVTYRYPNWTGLQNGVDRHGGDLRAVEGTDADLEIQMDRPLRNGILALDNDRQIRLSGGQGNLYKGTIHMDKDGTYHVAALDQGQPVRLSEDFFIEAGKANPPEVAIDRPGRDYRASPIEEVTVTAKAADDFGLNEFNLHYSVNGGPDKTVNLLKQKGAKSADGSTVLYLENFKLVPGDLVSIYATAKDAKAESRTDMFFIQADPFEREFSQSQQMAGGGGGGGGGMGGQADISEREKEIIASTWKQQGDKTASEKQSADTAKFLSGVQSTLRDQALSLAGRLQSRELSEQNDEFNAFQQDMTAAAEAMAPAAQKLKQQEWQDSIPAEQKALQHLLRAEATFRQIEVAFGQAGGGGGGAGSAGRDLASLFDLELDTEKNQYETAQTAASSSDHHAKDIDDALQKLDELARRQQDLAQQRNNSAQNLQERWQQEMLRRDAEQLQRQLEQLAQNNQNGQGNPQGSSSSGSSGQSASGQAGQSGQSSGQAGQSRGASDPRVQQALDRLRQANDDMRRADSGQQGNAEARRAADRLREATNMLAGAQQQHASGRLDAMGQEADRLAGEERDQADRLHKLFGNQQGSDQGAQNSPYGSFGGRFGSYGRSQIGSEAQGQEAQKLADDRQHLADDLAHLETQMRDASRDLASNQISAATKLRNALGDLDSSDLETRIQRSADWLRRGIDPNSTSTEQEIGSGLQKLSDAVRQAQQALGSEQPQDSQTALDRVERLRNRLEAMEPNGRRGQGGARGGQAGQSGQPGQLGQNGGPISRTGQTGPGGNFGAVIGGGDRGGRDYYGGFDKGNNSNLPQPVGPNYAQVPGDTEGNIRQGVNELNQLRGTLQDDPEAQREIDALIQKMQQLDPRRFPGNPALVEQLHTQVLNDVDKLELQLQRKQDDKSGDIRSTNSGPMPAGYQDAVADYFRRLSNTH
ncbi:MAG TPA: hypothetical protein VNE63_11465 [Candidatus Acidoferrales bacterium]|nr:hypothetical protein [Candidatus Acidoferrales bacterium]